ncbi:MAG: copper amine oxidase N-terminal domain-containing protein [Oscillospiraceae bacterium]|nr:copper amine oxidase N-terminal domain-containing protein [Oscillospiraceae bacterium]
MKFGNIKKTLLVPAALILAATLTFSAYAKTEPVDLKFSPAGGGTFIYCNNNESVRRERLSDTSNPEPEYLMTNLSMSAGKYSLYASHLNHTELRNADGMITEAGFDIEVDVRFLAEEDTVISLSSAAFETPELSIFYENGMLMKEEGDWGCIQAVADYMQRPIRQLNADTEYKPAEFKEVKIELKKGEEMWLSKYIDNYRSIAWLKPVQILADFEILSGSAEIDVAALRSNGTVGDRSLNDPEAKFGAYHRDREHKGLADTLPFMYSEKMEYTVDDSVLSGSLLPVTLYNQVTPGGNTVEKWFTHLNPQTDAWSSAVCSESEMIKIYYDDPSKAEYYGKNVPESDREETWYFDTTHSDTAEYLDGMEVSPDDYKPNYRIPDGTVNYDAFGCHLGNYGIGVNYVVSIKNTSSRVRYFNYNLRTTANNIVNVRDEKGEYVGEYSLLKGRSEEKREDTMACIKLPPDTETSFMIEVLLPMNYPGGMENSFVITDTPADMSVLDDTRLYKITPDKFTGGEYFKWAGEEIYTSYDRENWTRHELSQTTKEIFRGNWNNYDIAATDRGYMAKCSEYQTSPAYYSNILNYYHTVYFLDKNFNVTGRYTFDEYPNEIAFARGKYYVKTDNYIYYSEDTDRWKTLDTNSYDMPIDNGGIFSVTSKGGEHYVSTDGVDYVKTAYPPVEPENGGEENLYFDEKESKTISGKISSVTEKPLYIDTIGDYYFYASANTLYLSKTALKWHSIDFDEKITSVTLKNKDVYINNRYKLLYDEDLSKSSFMRVNDEIMSLDGITAIINDRTVVPVRLLSEYFGAKVIWNPDKRTVNIYYNGDTIVYTIDSDEVRINSSVKKIDTTAVILNNTTMIPIRAFAECMSLDFDYDESIKLISIKSPEKVFDGIAAYPDGSLPGENAVPDAAAAEKLAETFFAINYGEDFLFGFGKFSVFYNELTGCYEATAKSEVNEGIFIEAVIEKSSGKLISLK